MCTFLGYNKIALSFFKNNELNELNEFTLAAWLYEDRAIGQEKKIV